MRKFVDAFEKLKNVNFIDSIGLEELRKMHVDKESLVEFKEIRELVLEVAAGASAGIAGGALTALGAYGAATVFGAASTGTAISALSGAAATNATLAFFGGGSLAAGGLGMAGGAAVLGGLVVGPALLVMGLITEAQASKQLDLAKENAAKADEIEAELCLISSKCDAIRRRANMFYAFISRLDVRFIPQILRLEDIIDSEGVDYSKFSQNSQETVVKALSLAKSIKSLIDTPILTEDGTLTDQSEKVIETIRL